MKKANFRMRAWPSMVTSIGLLSSVGWSADAGAEVSFALTELVVPGGSARSFANAINNNGSIIVNGQWLLPSAPERAIELLPNYSLSLPPVTGLFAGGLDDSGVVTGYIKRDSIRNVVNLARWTPTAINSFNELTGVETALPPTDVGSFYARAVNNAGLVVGNDGDYYGYQLGPTGYVNLNTQLGGYYGKLNATGINSAGQVVGSIDGRYGFITTPGLSTPGPATWDIGTIDVLRPVTAAIGPLLGINNLGVVVGTDAQGSFISYNLLGTVFPNVLPQRAIVRPLIDPSTASFAYANAINDDGLIVGETTAGKAALLTPHGTLYWVGSGRGLAAATLNFNDAANWGNQANAAAGSQPFAPNRLIDIQVSGQTYGGSPAALVSASLTAKSLSLGDAGKADQGGVLEVGQGAVLTALDGVSVYATSGLGGSGTIVVGRAGGSIGRFEVNANLDLHTAGLTILGGPLVNHGTIFADGQLTAELVNQGYLVVGLGSTRNFKLVGTQHVNQGGISVTSGGTLEVQGSLMNGSDQGGGGSLDLAGTLRINDALTFRGPVVEVQPGGAIDGRADITQTGGRFEVSASGTVTAHSLTVRGDSANNALLTIDGTLDTWPAGDATAVVKLQGGVLNGNGRINGELFVGGGPSTAIFKPGHSPGSFTIGSTFTLLPGGELELEVQRGIGGALAFDVVTAGHMMLDGLVRIKLGTDLGNASFQSLQLLNCGKGCEFGSHFSWILEGGDVQALPTFSANGLQLSVPAALLPVPEPASWLLWLVGIVGCLLRTRTVNFSNQQGH